MPNLLPHQERVVAEEAKLNERLNELKAFISTPLYLALDLNEQLRLCEQMTQMKGYSEGLARHIKEFTV
jgi:hypothetical protein